MHKVVVIGAGFAGLCIGIKLKQAGIEDFIILEKAPSLGGTWRENTYPGAECDIPSTLYSFSFAPNAEWNYKWSEQPQILDYQRHTAESFGLTPHFRFNTAVSQLQFDEKKCVWQVKTDTGQMITAQHVVSAVGQLHVPQTPVLEGVFGGTAFHSAQWQHDCDLSGKRVAVIGNAASALQFIPEIQPQVSHLYVLQRSANWVLPKLDRPYASWEKWLSAKVPAITKLYRFSMWLKGESVLFSAIKGNRLTQWILRTWSKRYLKANVSSEALRQKLTPDYPVGAKRILFSDNYYGALNQPNVTLVTQKIARLAPQGIELEPEQTEQASQAKLTLDVDVIIYATGFVTNPFLSQINVVGRDQKALDAHWQEGAHAYLGVSTHGFPNLHLLYGPNTNLGHSSILIMLEAQANAIIQLIKQPYVEVKEAVETDFNAEQQARLNKLAFANVSASWYKVGERITNNWAGRTTEYRSRLKKLKLSDYLLELPR